MLEVEEVSCKTSDYSP